MSLSGIVRPVKCLSRRISGAALAEQLAQFDVEVVGFPGPLVLPAEGEGVPEVLLGGEQVRVLPHGVPAGRAPLVLDGRPEVLGVAHLPGPQLQAQEVGEDLLRGACGGAAASP